MTKPKQRVILYRHGLDKAKEKREKKAAYYRKNSGKEYFPCPGCKTQVSINAKTKRVNKHYADYPNRIPCLYKED